MSPRTVYTHGHHESVHRSHRWRTASNSAAYLLPHIAPGASVLDVGCGTGNITVDLARIVAPGTVVGVDLAADPLGEARTAAADSGHTNVTFRQGEVYALDYPDASFDVVHAHQLLQHLSDPVAALREMERVCKPGGVVAARDADYAAMTWYPAGAALDEWLDLYHRLARANGAEPDAGRRLVSWARAAGLTDVTPSATAWCHATPADRAWWGGVWADRVTSSAFATQAVERGLATTEQLAAIAAGWRDWAAHPDAWFGILHGEILARV